MFRQKEKLLFLYVMEHKETFVTSREIAEHLDCSDRSVRTYYKTIAEALEPYKGVELIAKQGQGYCLKITDYQQFQTFLHDFQLQENRLNHYDKAEIADRHSYILNKLLFEQEEVYFDDLADEFFVSRSTLSSDFKKIREQLQRYDLKVESKPNKGVFVSGTERNKRRFIMDYFFDNRFVNTLHQYIDSEFFHQNITFEELMIIVLDECREASLKLSDFVLQNLIIHIALTLRRVSEGFQINKLDMVDSLKDSNSRKVAAKILERVELVTGIAIPAEEIDYITLHLVAKGSYSEAADLSPASLAERLRVELVQAIEETNPPLGQAFPQDFQLIEGLVTHLETLLIRLENKIILENPLLSDIENNYRETLDLSRQIMALMPTFATYHLSEDELAYITLHFLASIERFKEKSKHNILVICATGYGSAQMLKSRIENELGNLVSIVDVIGYYEINDEKLENIDFIISSIDLSNLIFSIPVYTVSVFLKEDEVRMIKQSVAENSRCGRTVQSEVHSASRQVSDIFDEYFSPSRFFIYEPDTPVDKSDVLTEMITSLAEEEEAVYPHRMRQLVDQRESMSSVVFSDTIAVPHPISPVGHYHRIAVAIVPTGVAWEADYPSIRLVFLPSLSVYDNEGLEKMTRLMVDLVDRPDIQQELLACRTFEEFRMLFLSIEER